MVLIDSLIPALLHSFIASLIVMTIAFVVSIRTNRIGVADAAWGLTFIAIGFTAFITNNAFTVPMVISLLLVSLWGARLARHVITRLVHAKEDDRRYVEIAKKWPKKYRGLQLYSRIFMVQAILAVIIMMPVIVIAINRELANPLFILFGTFIWICGFITESIADRQLAQFIRNKPGSLMQSGLWRYSRHPNYFGELTQWIGIAVIALGVPGGWLGLVGPLVLSVLILFVSGIPPAEKNMSKKRGWEEYVSHTSVLIPLPPRS